MTADEELDELFVEYAATRQRRVRNRLVEAHLPFAYHVARRYAGRGVSLDDLRQTALLALVKSVDRFDPGRGFAFTSFAGPSIEGELKRLFRDESWTVRVPRSTQELHLAIRNATSELEQTLGRSPTAQDVAAHIDATLDDVVGALGVGSAHSPSSLDAPLGGQDDSAATPSDRVSVVEQGYDDAIDRRFVERLLSALPEREQTIVRLRFYDQLTQSEIAERVGVSQMHVSRLLRHSLEAMREVSRGTAGE